MKTQLIHDLSSVRKTLKAIHKASTLAEVTNIRTRVENMAKANTLIIEPDEQAILSYYVSVNYATAEDEGLRHAKTSALAEIITVYRHYKPAVRMVDINGQQVQIQISADGSKLWVNVEGVCRLRASNISGEGVSVIDDRPIISAEHLKLRGGSRERDEMLKNLDDGNFTEPS